MKYINVDNPYEYSDEYIKKTARARMTVVVYAVIAFAIMLGISALILSRPIGN